MSVVAGKIYEDKLVVAADSIVVRGWSKRTDNFSKLVSINDMIIGGTGSAEEISLLVHFAKTHRPETASERDVLEFIVEFSKWKKDYGDAAINNEYMIACGGHLFRVSNMFVVEVHNYDAIGAGEDFANAALYLGHDAVDAVKVACNLCCFVAEPVISFEMKREVK